MARCGSNVARAAVLVVVVAACGDQALTRSEAVEAFGVANPDATPAQAGCVVDQLIDDYGLDGLEAELDAPEPDPAFGEAQLRHRLACGIDGDVRAQLADQLAAAGVDEADAPCVADVLVDDLDGDDLEVLRSGEGNEAFTAEFFAALDTCGALNPETE